MSVDHGHEWLRGDFERILGEIRIARVLFGGKASMELPIRLGRTGERMKDFRCEVALLAPLGQYIFCFLVHRRLVTAATSVHMCLSGIF